MDKPCTICDLEGKYKCPTCLVYYCSAACCQKHRDNGCKVVIGQCETTKAEKLSQDGVCRRFTSADTVPAEKLQLLGQDRTLNDLLCNPHLRQVLTTVNESSDPEKIMQMAMQEPLFVEFADACLKVVEPPHED